MEPKKKPPIDYREVLEVLTSLNPLGAIASNVIPANAKAFLRYVTGDETPLSNRDIQRMSEPILRAIKNAEAAGRNYVMYEDYGDGAKNDTQAISEMGVFGESGVPATTLGRFNFKKTPEGEYEITDSYDFDKKDQSKKKVIEDLGLEEDASPYDVFRASQEKEDSLSVPGAYRSLRRAISFFEPEQEIQPQTFRLKDQQSFRNGGKLLRYRR